MSEVSEHDVSEDVGLALLDFDVIFEDMDQRAVLVEPACDFIRFAIT